jgi:hypothetical protein
MSVEQKYAARMHRDTGLYPAWPPNAPISIGDFGPFDGKVFKIFGRLAPAEVSALALRDSPSAASYEILADAQWSISAGAHGRAKIPTAKGKVRLEVGFSAEDGFSFTASQATITQATDLQTLGHILNGRRTNGGWDMSHGVVVEVIQTAKTTVLISNKLGGGMDFEVAVDTPASSALASLDAKTSVLWSDGIRTRIIGEGPLTPLFRLAQLQKKFFTPATPTYRSLRLRKPLEPPSLPDPPISHVDIDQDHVLAMY